MTSPVIVIGAGMGGLAAALRLANAGYSVQVLEARSEPGGLASEVRCGGFTFDAGPYILLDRPGLEWSFERLGLNLATEVTLLPVHDIYEVESERGTLVRFYADLEKTANGFEEQWHGSGKRYRDFVSKMQRILRLLQPMLTLRPGALGLIRTGAWIHAPFLMKSLQSVLARAGLPSPVTEALGIWTHVAGQTMSQAPSPMAFVPALMHTVGSYYPEAGLAAVPRALERAARRAGVGFHYGVKVQRICSENEKVVGVTTGSGEFIPASVVVSNAAAIGTYLHLLDQVPEQTAELKKLPLQSPGVCAYLAVRGRTSRHYLRFKLGGHNDKCRLLIQPAVLGERQQHSDWHPARLLSPMDYDAAERSGPAGQLQFLERLLAEEWWRTGLSEVRIIATRTPQQWGSEYNLYANSMNPVMTARFMRHGRFAHRSPYVRGLYLAGSSTHPGQWVSFCAISGILAADRIIEDFS